MSSEFTVRAWKDPHFREALHADVRAALPNHPAGVMAEAESREPFGGGVHHATRMPRNVDQGDELYRL